MARRTWTLTEVTHDLWVEEFAVSARDLGLPADQNWWVRKRTLRGGLCDGVDLIEVSNGPLSFSVLPTRGMGIWRGQYRGRLLGWHSPVLGPVHPKFVNLESRGGLGWLTGFDEWIVRCGLDSNGAPGTDVVLDNNGNPIEVPLTLHGRIANQPAHFVAVEVQTEPPYEISVVGHVRESGLFYPQLELRTRISTVPGSGSLSIRDEVVNLKGVEAELELLYHCNFGPPFLEAGSRLLAPIAEVAPRDARAAEGIERFDSYDGPTPGYVEQVYWFDLLSVPGTGRTLAVLRNAAGDLAVAVRFDKRQLPCFSLWKNTAAVEDGYVTGLEPGTNYPNLKRFERERGRVIKLPAGGSYTAELSIEAVAGRSDVERLEREVAELQKQAERQVHRQPVEKWSPR